MLFINSFPLRGGTRACTITDKRTQTQAGESSRTVMEAYQQFPVKYCQSNGIRLEGLEGRLILGADGGAFEDKNIKKKSVSDNELAWKMVRGCFY